MSAPSFPAAGQRSENQSKLSVLQLLAGANVNELTLERQTCLHLAAVYSQPAIASVLIENGVDYGHLDQQRCNGRLAVIVPLS